MKQVRCHAVLRISVVVFSILILIVAVPVMAVAQTDEDRARMCLDGELEPRSLVAEATFEGQRYELNCGSPISFGVLHIDDDHPIHNVGDFIACFRRMVTDAGPPEEDPARPYLVRKMNVVLGVSKAILVYEHGGNVQTMYTTGPQSNHWRPCAAATVDRPLSL